MVELRALNKAKAQESMLDLEKQRENNKIEAQQVSKMMKEKYHREQMEEQMKTREANEMRNEIKRSYAQKLA